MRWTEKLLRELELAEEIFGMPELEEHAARWREENSNE